MGQRNKISSFVYFWAIMYFWGEFFMFFEMKLHWGKNGCISVSFFLMLYRRVLQGIWARGTQTAFVGLAYFIYQVRFISYSCWISLCFVTVPFVFRVLSFDFPLSQVNCWVCTNSNCCDKPSKIPEQEWGLPLFFSR